MTASLATHRAPAVAGQFYPAEPKRLAQTVRGYLAQATQASQRTVRAPKALIVPHAGYPYSGPVAASAYAQLAGARDTLQRVVLFGPSHRVGFRGLALCGVDYYDTPLGAIEIDHASDAQLLALPQVHELPEAHRYEHSLEVQLPFLQIVLSTFRLLPFSVGDATADEVAAVLDLVWGGPETLILISTDLSHYHEYESARVLDQRTTAAIEALRDDALDSESACGRVALRGMLRVARARGLTIQTLDLRNSGDTSGMREQVVGYGAYAVVAPHDTKM